MRSGSKSEAPADEFIFQEWSRGSLSLKLCILFDTRDISKFVHCSGRSESTKKLIGLIRSIACLHT